MSRICLSKGISLQEVLNAYKIGRVVQPDKGSSDRKGSCPSTSK